MLQLDNFLCFCNFIITTQIWRYFLEIDRSDFSSFIQGGVDSGQILIFFIFFFATFFQFGCAAWIFLDWKFYSFSINISIFHSITIFIIIFILVLVLLNLAGVLI